MTRQLLINGRFLGGGQTAVNMVAHALTEALCSSNTRWDVSIAIPRNLRNKAIPSDWTIREIGTRSGIAWEQIDLPKLRRDAVIAGFFNTVPLQGRGYVTMLHDAHVFSTPQSYGRTTGVWRRMLSRQAGRQGNHVLTVSEHSKKELLQHKIGAPQTIGVTPNGPGPVSRMCPDTSILGRLALRADTPFCVAVASVLPHKNISILLKAFAKPQLAEVKLVLFGSADRTSFEQAGHVVPPNVIFSGFVRDAELSALYRNCSAVCIPSTAEGFGLPALEAMKLGRPVIISPCGALPEVAGNAALTAAPDDPAAWATAILRLLADTKLRSTLIRGAQTRARSFTWDAAAQAVLRHLDRWYPV